MGAGGFHRVLRRGGVPLHPRHPAHWIGAALFGAYWGFVYVWLGAMAGASGAFWIGRTLGRDFAAGLVGDRLKKYDEAIGRNGFAAVLYLRLVYFPIYRPEFRYGVDPGWFPGLFYRYWFGHHGGHIYLYFFCRCAEGYLDLRPVGPAAIHSKYFSPSRLFVFSFFIPLLIKRIKREI